ncbi:hypothetical protein [Saccharopolyspora gloriosae]|uniref:hypothetical protein n=1 Tax=Saccharopolyspora gloriosae TaxID=455344 RepID=UPI001FB73271|nr:hypothetical protein [Saccharopolyspora gloriosae]
MSRDSGSEHPSQRTVAELLAEYGGGSQKNAHRRRRRAEDPSETAPQAIIERVLSDSGTMRAIKPDEDAATGQAEGAAPPAPERPQAPHGGTGPQAPVPPNAGPPAPPAAPQAPQYGGPPSGPPSGPQPAGPPPGPPRPGPQPNAAPPAAGPPPAPAGPVPPNAPGPHAGPAPAAEPAPPEDDVADPDQGSGFWARRFAAAGAPPRATAPAEPDTGHADAEMTVQQPALPGHAPAGPPPVEGVTEQLPRVEAEAKSAGAEGTAMMAYPGTPEAPQRSDDPYDFDDYEDYDRTGNSYSGEAAYDYADGGEDTRYHRDGYDADDEFDDYDEALPAGLDADDYRADDADEVPERTTGKEWLVLALQGGAGLVCGGVMWFAFRWLWTAIPIAALVAALAITGALVFVARKFLRTDDLQTILLAVLVGLICTVSPAALLIGQ